MRRHFGADFVVISTGKRALFGLPIIHFNSYADMWRYQVNPNPNRHMYTHSNRLSISRANQGALGTGQQAGAAAGHGVTAQWLQLK